MDNISFKPGNTLTYDTVVDIRLHLVKTIKEYKPAIFCLDLSDVVRCDSAGLALLIEIRKLCEQRNKKFKLIGVSPETQSLAEFCGLRGIIETAEI
jgi:phospholipid transport system transporter-binding protein